MCDTACEYWMQCLSEGVLDSPLGRHLCEGFVAKKTWDKWRNCNEVETTEVEGVEGVEPEIEPTRNEVLTAHLGVLVEESDGMITVHDPDGVWNASKAIMSWDMMQLGRDGIKRLMTEDKALNRERFKDLVGP